LGRLHGLDIFLGNQPAQIICSAGGKIDYPDGAVGPEIHQGWDEDFFGVRAGEKNTDTHYQCGCPDKKYCRGSPANH
jgi:hypothetical protein